MAAWSSDTTHTDVSQVSENPELRKEVRFRRWKIATLLVVVIGGLGLGSKPAYQSFRKHQIDANLEAAKVAARLEDWGTTRDRARAVLLARDGDFEAFRLWTRALGKMGEPRTYMAAAQLFMSPQATRQDRLECLRVMAQQAPQAVAFSAFSALPQDLRNDAAFRASLTPLMLRRGEVVIAERAIREVSKDDDPPEVRLELLRVLCAKPTPERLTEARHIFAGFIAAGLSEPALNALEILGETPGGLASGEPLPDLIDWIKDQPKAKTIDHLLALEPRFQGLPENAPAIVQRAIDTYLPTDPGVVGTWLIKLGRADEAAKVLEDYSDTRADAYIARLHALMKLNRQEDLDQALAHPPDSADMVEIEIVRAAMAWRRNDKIVSSSAWTRALDRAAFDTSRNRFIEVARSAELFRADGAAEDAWVAAICSGWGQLPLYRDVTPLIASLAAKSRSEDLFSVCRNLQRFESLNPDLNNNYQYLGLIQGVFSPQDVKAALTELLKDHPDMPEINSALMLADLMAGEPQQALDRLAQLKQTDRVSGMMENALEGSARVMMGDTQRGTELLSSINWNLFMRQEQIVFRGLLVKLKVANLPLPELEDQAVKADPDDIPAWRKAVKKSEQERASDILRHCLPLKYPEQVPLIPKAGKS